MTELLAVLLFAGGIAVVFRGFVAGREGQARTEGERRLQDVIAATGIGEEWEALRSRRAEATGKVTLIDRLAAALAQNRLLRRLVGTDILYWLDRELVLAGRPKNLRAIDAIAYALLIWGLGGGLILMAAFSNLLPSLLAALALLLIVLYPPLKLRQLRKTRQTQAQLELLGFIQAMRINLTSGLATIDDAIGQVVDDEMSRDSVLVREFGQAYAEWRHANADREEALHAVNQRIGVQAVDNFVDALVAGLRTGTPIAQTLESQYDQVQRLHREAMREFIKKKESSFIFSLVLIMLGVLVMIAAPIFMQVMDAFK